MVYQPKVPKGTDETAGTAEAQKVATEVLQKANIKKKKSRKCR